MKHEGPYNELGRRFGPCVPDSGGHRRNRNVSGGAAMTGREAQTYFLLVGGRKLVGTNSRAGFTIGSVEKWKERLCQLTTERVEIVEVETLQEFTTRITRRL